MLECIALHQGTPSAAVCLEHWPGGGVKFFLGDIASLGPDARTYQRIVGVS